FSGGAQIPQVAQPQLHLGLGARLELPHPLARDAKRVAELLERRLAPVEVAPLDDVPLARIEIAERALDAIVGPLLELALGDHRRRMCSWMYARIHHTA